MFPGMANHPRMLGTAERKILEDSLDLILTAPQNFNQSSFIKTYNTVYTHCSAPSQAYHIEGEAIYLLIRDKIFQFSNGLSFKSSLQELAGQLSLFRVSVDVLNRVFSYIERFYIKASIYKALDVDRLSDVFFSHVYFNYIFEIEENLLDLIFLEIETARYHFRQDCTDLKTVVGFYLDVLVLNGQEEKLTRFYKLYLSNFVAHTNFDSEIGKLLKRVYLEMYFVSNIIGDKGMCVEIVSKLEERKEDVFNYLMGQVEVFENFKHIFKILNMMDESLRTRFRHSYTKLLSNKFKSLSSFKEIFSVFCCFRKQIITNKMVGCMEELERILKEDFIDRASTTQERISKDAVNFLDRVIRQYNLGGASSTDDRSIIAGLHSVMVRNFSLLADEGGFKGSSNGAEGGSRPESAPLFNGAQVRLFEENILNFEYLVVFISRIFNEVFLDQYLSAVQHRLLNGYRADIEKTILDKLVETVGFGSVSKLKSIINTYMIYNTQTYQVTPDEAFRVSLLKHTSGFWDIEKQDLNLPTSLLVYLNNSIEAEDLEYRQRIHVNYTLSPLAFELNGTRYRMNTDAVSLLLHVIENDGIATVEDLKGISGDHKFEYNLSRLICNGFVRIEEAAQRTSRKQAEQTMLTGCAESNHLRNSHHSYNPSSLVIYLNKKTNEKFIDLFIVPNAAVKNERVSPVVVEQGILIEAALCRALKRSKEMDRGNLVAMLTKDSRGFADPDIREAIVRLVKKGYFEDVDEVIKYIP